jgi:hypothetical protein
MSPDFVDIAIAVIFLGAVVAVWKVGGDEDLPWEERWRDLPPADRARITAAARSGALLASEEEIELAAGFARRDRRRRGPFSFLYAVRIPVGLILIDGGLLAHSLLFLLFGTAFLLAGLWSLRRTLQISRAEREAISRDRRV